MITKNEIKALIQQNKLEDAISKMLKASELNGQNDLNNDLIMQSGSNVGNENSYRSGILSEEKYLITKNKLKNAILYYLKQLNVPDGKAVSIIIEPNTPNLPPPSEAQSKTKILFMASNPAGTSKLQLDKEHSTISIKLQESKHYDCFRLITEKDVYVLEFKELITTNKPDILHFSGHGDGDDTELQDIKTRAAGRNKKEKQENNEGIILFEDEYKRNYATLSTAAIDLIFKSIKRRNIPLQVVLFNACYSAIQAKAISQYIPYVIGTSSAVKDNAAIAFATGFYFEIASQKSITKDVIINAFETGRTNAVIKGETFDKFMLYVDGELAQI